MGHSEKHSLVTVWPFLSILLVILFELLLLKSKKLKFEILVISNINNFEIYFF